MSELDSMLSMQGSAEGYLTALIRRIKASGEFDGVRFIKSYDGMAIESFPKQITVYCGVGKCKRVRKLLSPYISLKKHLLEIELELRVAAPRDAGVLSEFCAKLESAIRSADINSISETEISAAGYSEQTTAIFRIIKVKARIIGEDNIV